jgi:hypothetical protein
LADRGTLALSRFFIRFFGHSKAESAAKKSGVERIPLLTGILIGLKIRKQVSPGDLSILYFCDYGLLIHQSDQRHQWGKAQV